MKLPTRAAAPSLSTDDVSRALKRAAKRARETAIATRTTLVVNRRGKTVELDPNTMKPIAPRTGA